MGFGLRDSDWAEPPDPPRWAEECWGCENFVECPCGCGWGLCLLFPEEIFYGDCGCEDGRGR